MREELLKNIVTEIAGEEAKKIVDLLHAKKNINEFLIAKKLNLTINQARNILYKLSDVRLVSFIRKKDSKKGGWYTYFWTLDVGKSIQLLKNNLEKKLDHLREEMAIRKIQRFYYSPGADIEYTEEQALENDFICPETGDVLQLKDNSELIEKMGKRIAILQTALEDVDKEVVEIEKKEEKAKSRKLRKEKKEKDENRKKKRLERQKAAKREKKKLKTKNKSKLKKKKSSKKAKKSSRKVKKKKSSKKRV